jgi:hypothetical protein
LELRQINDGRRGTDRQEGDRTRLANDGAHQRLPLARDAIHGQLRPASEQLRDQARLLEQVRPRAAGRTILGRLSGRPARERLAEQPGHGRTRGEMQPGSARRGRVAGETAEAVASASALEGRVERGKHARARHLDRGRPRDGVDRGQVKAAVVASSPGHAAVVQRGKALDDEARRGQGGGEVIKAARNPFDGAALEHDLCSWAHFERWPSLCQRAVLDEDRTAGLHAHQGTRDVPEGLSLERKPAQHEGVPGAEAGDGEGLREVAGKARGGARLGHDRHTLPFDREGLVVALAHENHVTIVCPGIQGCLDVEENAGSAGRSTT